MAATVATLIAVAQRTLPDLGTTAATDLINRVHKQILALMPELCRDVVSTVTLVAGTQEYALDDETYQVDSVVWIADGGAANGSLQLGNTSIEYLNAEVPGWRQNPETNWASPAAEATSIDFYITSSYLSSTPTRVIGFNYPPDTATATGSLNIYQSRLESPPLTLSSEVFGGLYSDQVYVEGLLYYGAREVRPTMASAFMQAYAYEMSMNRMYLRTLNEGMKKPKIKNIRATGLEYPGDDEETQNGTDSAPGGGR
jgi:hypothetical protein